MSLPTVMFWYSKGSRDTLALPGGLRGTDTSSIHHIAHVVEARRRHIAFIGLKESIALAGIEYVSFLGMATTLSQSSAGH